MAVVLGRRDSLFAADWARHEDAIRSRLTGRRVLVIGGAGSIGSATVRLLVRFQPALLVILDTSENNLVELTRWLRSDPGGRLDGQLVAYPLDFGSELGLAAVRHWAPFDLVLNFAALKHVRSEKDIFSALQIFDTNVLKPARLLELLGQCACEAFFSVSSDKAVRPANLMGASKRLMEQVLLVIGGGLVGQVCSARFANVAFSDGSLLEGFCRRIAHRQPLAGPSNVMRYFISPAEAAQLCLLAAVLADDRQIFVPRPSARLCPRRFDELADLILRHLGFEPRWYDSAEAARAAVADDLPRNRYPCCFLPADTAGEKLREEFISPGEQPDQNRFEQIDVIVASPTVAAGQLDDTLAELERLVRSASAGPTKTDLLELVKQVVPELAYCHGDQSLDQKM